jgi:(2R)-ethylmalonyl-CoA mutase
VESLQAWRAARDRTKVAAALENLGRAACAGENVMEPSIACAHAGVTTGEWADALRAVFGEYRAPTGVAGASATRAPDLAPLRARAAQVAKRLGRPIRFLIGKPGLDGHSNGAEQIAVRARDAGLEVIYQGIRLSPEEIATAALQEGADAVGLSVLSGSHLSLVGEVMERLRAAGAADVPVIAGGIIPPKDAEALLRAGVARVYSPKDFDLNAIVGDIVEIVGRSQRGSAQ